LEILAIKSLEIHFPKPCCPDVVTPEIALMHFYDIYSPIPGIMYNTLSFFAVDNEEILKLSSFGTDFLTFGKSAYPHLPALLQDFNSISLDFVDLIMLLPRIQFKAGHIQDIQTEESSSIVDICLLSHSEIESEIYINHITSLSKNDEILLQRTGTVNNHYKKLPELAKENAIFFVEDISVCFLSSFLPGCRTTLDWHVVLKPNEYWTSILQEEIEDGKIQSLVTYDRPLEEIEHMNKLKHLKNLVICIISPKSEFETYRKNIHAWNGAFSHNALQQVGRWIEIDVEEI